MRNLPRTFIYRDRKELDEFLKDNELNEALYDVFLDVKDNYYNLKVSAETIFNEVYHQCTRLMLDPHPEARVWDYLNDAKNNTGWRYTSDLVFSMVYAILSLQPRLPSSIKRFLRCLEGKNLNECYFPAFKRMVDSWGGIECGRIVRGAKDFQSDFTSSPEPPERLFVHGTFSWSVVTKDYDQERIRMIVNLWSSQEDRLTVLNLIEDAFVYDEAFTGNAGKIEFDLPF